MAQHDFKQTATPVTPAANYDGLFFNASGIPQYVDSSGVVHPMGGVNGWYDVTAYGVSTTNTAAANLTAINLLLGTTATSGAIIYFPAGTYAFSGVWTALTKPFTFLGSYGSSYIQMASGVNANWITVNVGSNPTSFYGMGFCTINAGTQASGATIAFGNNLQPILRDCQWSGNGGTGTMFSGIDMTGSNAGNGAVIDGCNIGQCMGVGINISGTLGSASITNCLMTGTTSSGTGAVGIQCLSAGSIVIDSCDIIKYTNNLLLNPGAGVTIAAVEVTNTYFDQGVGSSVKITSSTSGSVARCRFIACYMAVGASGTLNAVEISATSTGVHTGMVFNDCWIFNANGNASACNGFSITGASDVVIADCQIAGFNPGNGITITPTTTAGQTSPIITDNTIGPSGGVGANATAINLAAGAPTTYGPISIQGNKLTGNTTALVDAATMATVGTKLVSDNLGLLTNGVLGANFTTTAATGLQSVTGLATFLPVGSYLVELVTSYVGAGTVGSTHTSAFSFSGTATGNSIWNYQQTTAALNPLTGSGATTLTAASVASPVHTALPCLTTAWLFANVTVAGTIQFQVNLTTAADTVTFAAGSALRVTKTV